MNKKTYLKFALLFFSLFFAACSSQLEIIENPISFSKERKELTREYIENHYGIENPKLTFTPKVIVLHWTAINDLKATLNLFNRETLGNSRPELQKAGQVNVSIQYVVDKDGSVYHLMPDTLMARHVIGINYCSIGVENIGGEHGIDDLTDDQIEANIKLVKYLVKKHSTIEYLIGHMEYTEFEGHPLWLEKDPDYRTEKSDPGKRFMNAVREGVKDLHLKGVKEIRMEVMKNKKET